MRKFWNKDYMLEFEYAKYLDENNIRWEKCKVSFPYEIGDRIEKYTPDFYLLDEDSYVEVKQYKTEIDEVIWNQFPSDKQLIVLLENDLIKLNINIIE